MLCKFRTVYASLLVLRFAYNNFVCRPGRSRLDLAGYQKIKPNTPGNNCYLRVVCISEKWFHVATFAFLKIFLMASRRGDCCVLCLQST